MTTPTKYRDRIYLAACRWLVHRESAERDRIDSHEDFMAAIDAVIEEVADARHAPAKPSQD